MSRLTFSGLSSGLNTDAIITQITRFNQRRIDTLKTRQRESSTRQSSLKAIQTRLTTIQSNLTKLGRVANGAFDARKAVSSDETYLKVAATSAAQPLSQTLIVNQLAKANIVGSQGFAASNSTINTGTFEISAGGSVASITIDSSNNTLQGLSSAINSAKIGVRATVVNTGTAGSPYKLLLTSEKTGTANAISITNNLDSGGATKPEFLTTVQAAQNAQVQIGSGGGAITVDSATNIISDLIPGVTLSLQKADPTKELTVTVNNDVDGIKTALTDLVKNFNETVDFIAAQTKSDPIGNTSGPLASNRQVTDLLGTLRSSIVQPSSTLPSSINRLSVFGITINRQGKLDIDDAKLTSVLNGEVDGIGIEDAKRAFALYGKSTNAAVSFLTATEDTVESATAYQVNITTAAEVASVTATDPLSGSTTIDNTNNTLTLSLDGVASGTITLSSGTYTDDELAAELQTRLRADSAIGRLSPEVSVNSGKLVITSSRYGSNSAIANLAGTALSALGFDGTETDTGVDVAGNFVVNGVVEAATGAGQTLTGNEGNTNTDGLRILSTFASTQISADVDAEITVTRGIATRLSTVLDGLLNLSTGRLKTIAEQLQSDTESIDKQITRETKQMSDREAALRRQFSSVEDVIAKSKANGDALTSGLSRLLNQ